ncbi:MAG: YhcN/YlaJ family sporulation lipoprotein [Tissierellaceae bacterium]
MKKIKIEFLAFAILVLVSMVGCTPNDTNMNVRDRNLSTQTRINNTRWNVGQDNLNRNLDNVGQNRILNDVGQNDTWNNGRNFLNTDDNITNNLNNGMTRPNNNITNNNITNNNNLTNNANEIARRIADLPEVDKASVVLTNDTALVGCNLRGTTQGTMTNALRNKIENIVRDTTNNIQNVSVTTDPNLYNRIQTISNNIGNGNPIEGFAEEVRDLIRRITPNMNTNTTR